MYPPEGRDSRPGLRRGGASPEPSLEALRGLIESHQTFDGTIVVKFLSTSSRKWHSSWHSPTSRRSASGRQKPISPAPLAREAEAVRPIAAPAAPLVTRARDDVRLRFLRLRARAPRAARLPAPPRAQGARPRLAARVARALIPADFPPTLRAMRRLRRTRVSPNPPRPDRPAPRLVHFAFDRRRRSARSPPPPTPRQRRALSCAPPSPPSPRPSAFPNRKSRRSPRPRTR